MDLNARCKNESWGTVRCEPTTDRLGRDVAVVVAKVAYAISPAGRVTLTFRPVRAGSTPDGFGGVLYPDDLVDEKLGTDVALVGSAHPPRGKTVDRQLAWLSVGSIRKVIQIFGRRSYVRDFGGVVPGPPSPLGETPLRWDQAFGGRDLSGDEFRDEPHNPVGRGFAADPRTLVGAEMPCLEPVADPNTGRVPHASHGCFAPIPPDWEPRRKLAGTHDEAWVKHRAPVRPKDFSVLHNSFAIPELRADKPLVGDEHIEVGGVTPEGLWSFRLPKYAFTFRARVMGEDHELPTHLDTILIDADRRVVELAWRARVLLPKKWEFVESIGVRGEGTMPSDVLEEDAARPKGRSAEVGA